MSDVEERARKRRIELSTSQVAGAGLATMTAATAASYLGVYGTIIGAAVMSVLSTAGTAVMQHFFQRSGDRAKDIAGRARALPRERGRAAGSATRDLTERGPGAAADADTLLAASTEPPEPSDTPPRPEARDAWGTRSSPGSSGSRDETEALGSAAGGGAEEPADETRAMPTEPDREETAAAGADAPPEDRRSWWRRWRGLLIPALAVFVLVMLVILAFELFTGRSLTDTVHGRDTRSGPTVLGGSPVEQQEQPNDEPAPGTENPEDQEEGTPQQDAPEQGEPGGETRQPGEEPGTGGDTEAPNGDTDDPGTGEDGGQQDAPEQDSEEQDGTQEDGTGDGGAAPQEGGRND
ncbi:hypothetical protein F4561_003031 [Lipingzhangella halophila]|uniref:Uncharacterized protein n=1 Tax=Lipingzhangella halophila TaxID=1783352 RepID=A0A7W7RHQ7_9ACTN|nr:hypothetical protein [Lipingzhangella halophila]MBB4932211.1 hypothetical protein [Lipingzhangella halophila]